VQAIVLSRMEMIWIYPEMRKRSIEQVLAGKMKQWSNEELKRRDFCA